MSASSTKSRLHLNSFEIKIIALIFMTFDHFGAYQTFTTNLSINDFFRIVGRIAAPLFLFVVVESLHYTHNKVRFAMRLYIAGVTVEIFNRIFESTFDIFSIGNILPTFFYVALIVTTTECITKCRNLKTAVIPLLCLIVPFLIIPLNIALCESGYVEIWDIISIIFPSIFTVEYSIIFILLGIAWYYIKDKRINCITFAALALLCFFVPDSVFYTLPLRCFSPLYFNISDLFIDGQWCMCLALPFMLLYDGEKGHSMKYFFYIYYPIHVYVLIIISQLRSASF